jgi:hypothetical protein
MIEQCEIVCTEALHGGDRAKTMDLLRVHHVVLEPCAIFNLGMAFGSSLLLLMAFILLLFVRADSLQHFKFYAAFPLYRGCFLLIFCMWCWGINVWVFHRSRVNHVFVLDADPNTTLTHVDILQFASSITFFYMVSIVSYMLMLTFGGM